MMRGYGNLCAVRAGNGNEESSPVVLYSWTLEVALDLIT